MKALLQASNRKKVIEVIVAVVIILSVVNYNHVNGENAYKITSGNVHFNNAAAEYDDDDIVTGTSACIYHIGIPRTEIKYSKFFKCDVFRYIIPFTATNISGTGNASVDIDQTIRVISAGNVWDSLPRSPIEPENDLNGKTKWTLKPGEHGSGYAIVDVVIDKSHTAHDLQKYKVYSVSRHTGVTDKYLVQ